MLPERHHRRFRGVAIDDYAIDIAARHYAADDVTLLLPPAAADTPLLAAADAFATLPLRCCRLR